MPVLIPLPAAHVHWLSQERHHGLLTILVLNKQHEFVPFSCSCSWSFLYPVAVVMLISRGLSAALSHVPGVVYRWCASFA